VKKIVVANSNRIRKCKLCDFAIAKGQEAIVMRKIHVSPHCVDLWFHIECLVEAIGNIDNIEEGE
jgi:hypothetical protein